MPSLATVEAKIVIKPVLPFLLTEWPSGLFGLRRRIGFGAVGQGIKVHWFWARPLEVSGRTMMVVVVELPRLLESVVQVASKPDHVLEGSGDSPSDNVVFYGRLKALEEEVFQCILIPGQLRAEPLEFRNVGCNRGSLTQLVDLGSCCQRLIWVPKGVGELLIEVLNSSNAEGSRVAGSRGE